MFLLINQSILFYSHIIMVLLSVGSAFKTAFIHLSLSSLPLSLPVGHGLRQVFLRVGIPFDDSAVKNGALKVCVCVFK